MTSTIRLDAPRVTKVLLWVFMALLLCHLFAAFSHLVLHRRFAAFTVLFDLDLEANMPMFFNSMLFFVLALVSYFAARTNGPETRRGWVLLACVFIFLGIDEGSQVHERFVLWSMRLMSNGAPGKDLGLFHYAWVVPYGIAAVVLVIWLSRFLLRLPKATRNGLVLSGAVYVFGAMIMEMISGKIARPLEGEATAAAVASLPCYAYPFGECNLYLSPAYVLIYTIEESLEMLGLIACIHMVMRYLQREDRSLTLEIPKAVERSAG